MKKLMLCVALLAGCSKAPIPELHVLNWAEYFAPDTIPSFEKEFGCRVTYDNFGSGEELRAKLERVPSGFDVVFPSDEVLPSLIAEGKLEKLDSAKLPNVRNIAAAFKGMAFDPKNEHSVPYMWGLTGIAWNKKKIAAAPESWNALFDVANQAHLVLLDDPREIFAAALRLEGADFATLTPELIGKAKARILAVRPKAWNSQPQAMFVQGDAGLAAMYHGDAAQVAADGVELGFVIPKEGGTLWFDTMAIAKGSTQVELAHKFIDYLMRPEVAAANTNFKKYPNPNEAARAHIRKEILENPMIYPPEADVKRCRPLGDLKPEIRKKLMDAWAEIKAR